MYIMYNNNIRYKLYKFSRDSLLYLLFFLPYTFAFGQLTADEISKIDSLKEVIENSPHDTITFNALFVWDDLIYAHDPDQSVSLLDRVVHRCREALNEKADDKEIKELYTSFLIDGYWRMGNTFSHQRQFERAIMYYDSSYLVSTKVNNVKKSIRVLSRLGKDKKALGEYDTAIESFEQAIKLGEENQLSPDLYTGCFLDVGYIYSTQGNLAKAIEYYQLRRKSCEKTGDQEGEAHVLSVIGRFYLNQYDFKQAEEYSRKAIELSEKINYNYGLYDSWNLLGCIYRTKGEFQLALDYINKGMSFVDESEDLKGMALSFLDIGMTYLSMNELDSALIYYQQFHSINKQLKDTTEIGYSHINLANAYHLKGDQAKAQEHGRQSFAIAQQVGSKLLFCGTSELLYKSYKATGNKAMALEMYENFISSRDSIQSETNQKEIIRQEYLRKASIDSIQYAKEQQLAAEKLNTQRQRYYFVIGGLILSTLLMGLMIYFYIQMRKTSKKNQLQAEELKQLDKVKSNFFANISHELRTPLTLILGPLSYLLDNPQEWEKEHIQKQLQVMQRNGKSLMQLIEEILDLSKLEANKLELQEEGTPLAQFFEYLFFVFEPQFRSQNLDYELNLDIREDLNVMIDRKKLEKVFNNFLSNAIKFTPKRGKITMNVKESVDQLNIQVTDTGKGIHPKDLPHIFERFYQSKQAEQKLYGGTGIGLALVNEFAQLMGGKAYAESTPGVGSKFFFEIPKKEVAAERIFQMISDDVEEKEVIDSIGTDFTILVVEDNADMRNFIFQLLQKKYKKVLLAGNGAEGLEILKEQGTNINLIVSDVMMPQVDGLTMLREIKSHSEWHRIPVVMLTALAAERDKLNALTIGVDDYLTKPFSVSELLIRVQNLLYNFHQRLKWQNQEEEPSEEAIVKSTQHSDSKGSVINAASEKQLLNEEDKEWVDELKTFIEKSLGEAQLDVKILSDNVFLSPRQLARKLKTITGLSPAKFIKEVQLQSARKTLENGTFLSISEVAQNNGFEYQGTFSKLFKKRFGKSPREYMK